MYYRPARTLFGLIAIGGAIAVGVTTHDAGFTALTFVGGLMLPRILGFRSHRPFGWHHGPGAAHQRGERMQGHFEERAAAWHRRVHGERSPDQSAPVNTAGA